MSKSLSMNLCKIQMLTSLTIYKNNLNQINTKNEKIQQTRKGRNQCHMFMNERNKVVTNCQQFRKLKYLICQTHPKQPLIKEATGVPLRSLVI